MDTDPPQAQVPPGLSLTGLRSAAADCRACELGEPATQTVFSAGSAAARLAFVGEQPGDQEDRVGQPFVGPAGKMLDRALLDVGLDRDHAYVTNAVKHFRFERTSSGRRLHKTPGTEHVRACRPWLLAELGIVDPQVVVLLGATATASLLGPSVRVTRDRGRLISRQTWPDEPAHVQPAWWLVTVHPSSILRADDREAAYQAFVADLRVAALALR
ncbi:MAG: uracil-DNA glycosylase [Actinomycetota bacterium]|nr:MAG: uracil-DNA glycosylase [Actinomycetota bacterium]